MEEIMTGSATPAQMGAFLTALRLRPGGETVEEIAGMASVMRGKAVQVHLDEKIASQAMDTCGTGGDGAGTFNVSTAAGILAAAAGASVAKHGNRSATSLCGSADVLEALGARIDLEPEAVSQCIDEVGFGFMFAPRHHAAPRHVLPVRKALGVRTIFNFLGPLTNPAGATRQLVGVFDPAYLELVASALVQLGAQRAAVVSGADGMDEISVAGETSLLEVTPGGVTHHTVSPERVGLERGRDEDVAGGKPEENAEITCSVLRGEQGSRRTLVVLNAGAALFVAGRAPGFEEGVRIAEEAIDSGAATDTLDRF